MPERACPKYRHQELTMQLHKACANYRNQQLENAPTRTSVKHNSFRQRENAACESVDKIQASAKRRRVLVSEGGGSESQGERRATRKEPTSTAKFEGLLQSEACMCTTQNRPKPSTCSSTGARSLLISGGRGDRKCQQIQSWQML